MNHLSEDDLVELYYGESTSEADAHVRACRVCSAQYAGIKQSLDGIRPEAIPQRGAEYGDRVWESLKPQLIPYETKAGTWRRWTHWRAASLAVSCAIVLALAFVGGRYWERSNVTSRETAVIPKAPQRVVLVVLTDHLDRTERLLVALKHADSPDRTENAQLQTEARELLASNRLYRTTASNSGDPVLAGALDRLEGVLAEIANDPTLTHADIQRVRKDMNTEGILFEIRVLLSHSPDQGNGPRPAKGATI